MPGKSHGQRSLESYNPWNLKESDMTEHIKNKAEQRGDESKAINQMSLMLTHTESIRMLTVTIAAAII